MSDAELAWAEHPADPEPERLHADRVVVDAETSRKLRLIAKLTGVDLLEAVSKAIRTSYSLLNPNQRTRLQILTKHLGMSDIEVLGAAIDLLYTQMRSRRDFDRACEKYYERFKECHARHLEKQAEKERRSADGPHLSRQGLHSERAAEDADVPAALAHGAPGS